MTPAVSVHTLVYNCPKTTSIIESSLMSQDKPEAARERRRAGRRSDHRRVVARVGRRPDDEGRPARRIGLCRDTTRAPTRGPRPKGGGTMPPEHQRFPRDDRLPRCPRNSYAFRGHRLVDSASGAGDFWRDGVPENPGWHNRDATSGGARPWPVLALGDTRSLIWRGSTRADPGHPPGTVDERGWSDYFVGSDAE